MATPSLITPPPIAAPAAEPTAAPELVPVPVDVSRIMACAFALAEAESKRTISVKQLALSELLREVRALPPNVVPMLPRVEPLEKVRREVNRDGLVYELQATTVVGRPHLLLKLLDVTGDDALAYCEPQDVRQLINDLRAVLAAVEGTAAP